VLRKAELSHEADSELPRRLLRDDMYYIELEVHKKTISYCVKDAAGHVYQRGTAGQVVGGGVTACSFKYTSHMYS
jgi:transposase